MRKSYAASFMHSLDQETINQKDTLNPFYWRQFFTKLFLNQPKISKSIFNDIQA